MAGEQRRTFGIAERAHFQLVERGRFHVSGTGLGEGRGREGETIRDLLCLTGSPPFPAQVGGWTTETISASN